MICGTAKLDYYVEVVGCRIDLWREVTFAFCVAPKMVVICMKHYMKRAVVS
jgi:hypothetical protein